MPLLVQVTPDEFVVEATPAPTVNGVCPQVEDGGPAIAVGFGIMLIVITSVAFAAQGGVAIAVKVSVTIPDSPGVGV